MRATQKFRLICNLPAGRGITNPAKQIAQRIGPPVAAGLQIPQNTFEGPQNIFNCSGGFAIRRLLHSKTLKQPVKSDLQSDYNKSRRTAALAKRD